MSGRGGARKKGASAGGAGGGVGGAGRYGELKMTSTSPVKGKGAGGGAGGKRKDVEGGAAGKDAKRQKVVYPEFPEPGRREGGDGERSATPP